MKKLYRRLEAFWTQYLLGPDWSPFVVASDLLKSPCSYCHFWRGVMLGGGLALALTGHFWAGAVLLALPVALAEAEETYSEDKK